MITKIEKLELSGTTAERTAMAITPGTFITFYETDTNDEYEYKGSEWIQTKINGAVPVTDGQVGIARNRFVSVTHNTLPVLATSGVASWTSPGVVGIVIDSVYISAGTMPLATTNYRIRYALDSENDTMSASLLPITEPSGSATADIGQVGSFNLVPVTIADTEAAGDLRAILLTLPNPVYIDLTAPITRLDFVHNLGAGVTIQLGIRAVEKL